MVNRRRFLLSGSAAFGGSLLLKGCRGRSAAIRDPRQPILVGSLLDATGAVSAVGVQMIAAAELAIAEINAAGGLLGRPVQLKQYDTQSDIQKYTQYAQQLVLQDNVDVLIGGITSAAREAIRPVVDKYKALYFYTTNYEGGLCDKYTFCTGVTPSGQIDQLLAYLSDRFQAKTIYTLAADYNFGQIAAKWTRFYGKKHGMEVIQEDFIPLQISDFSTSISKIQQLKPDAIVTVIVGANQWGFFGQWAATGLQSKIPLTCLTYNHPYVNDHTSKLEWTNIIVAEPFWVENPAAASQKFLNQFRQKFGADKYPASLAATHYTAIKLWAEAVKKAGTTDRAAVTQVLESGLTYTTGPLGSVSFDKTHHIAHTINILESTEDQAFNQVAGPFSNISALEDQGRCDLIARPNTSEQFTPKI
ncbi:ABC transporter substrate-binding protein [Phormidium sp. FACHB-592]|uniref:ABC transporter substrate-binding protein n=1 Tax=Stenomitos frigidus AS-A4 TaxID=2933935 RepID=A0ABV0KMU8_9CYAN|nr:ABC transporter substrate-binding protein [Phormidium sp. FACHB-592]MBD2077091.1 ABC transporter substrate-binding protein [Phormidium sp. FACHB-592]